jgi:ribosomal protein L22
VIAAEQTAVTGARAQAKYVRASARKARLVVEHIRGRSVPEARTVLAFSQRAVGREIEKVLRSAVANAEANHGLVGDDLIVGTATVDEGPTVKRWRPRARGRVNRIFKRTCHITIVLTPSETSGAVAPATGRDRSEAAAPAVKEPKQRRARTPKAAPPAAEGKPKRPRAKKAAEETPVAPQEPEAAAEETVAEERETT